MLDYEEMKYFVAFAASGTLSAVAEQYNISQPTITRAMKKAEAEFGVPLFERTKNSIKLNHNGALAADELALIIKQTDNMICKVKDFDRANRTIFVGSSAVVQLPQLIRQLTEIFPGKPISTQLKTPPELLEGLKKNIFQLIVMPFKPNDSTYSHVKIGEEHLMFLLPKGHPLAKQKSISLSDMDGENILLFSEIGFWADIVKTKMPKSKFLIQNERYSFNELIANSTLPCFTSDLAMNQSTKFNDRTAVLITDKDVNVTYYLWCKQENRKLFSDFFCQNKADLSKQQ